jgi:hypothetical protein
MASVRAHPHIKRARPVIGEATVVGIELVRGDAQVTENAFDLTREPLGVEDRSDVRVVGLNDNETLVIWRLEKSIRVAVDTDNAKRWISVKERTTVTSPTKCAIDDPTVCCWLEPGEDLIEHDWSVIRIPAGCGLIHGQPPGALAPKRKRAE